MRWPGRNTPLCVANQIKSAACSISNPHLRISTPETAMPPPSLPPPSCRLLLHQLILLHPPCPHRPRPSPSTLLVSTFNPPHPPSPHFKDKAPAPPCTPGRREGPVIPCWPSSCPPPLDPHPPAPSSHCFPSPSPISTSSCRLFNPPSLPSSIDGPPPLVPLPARTRPPP